MKKLLNEYEKTKGLNKDKKYQKLFSLLQKSNNLQEVYTKELADLNSKLLKTETNYKLLEELIAYIYKDLSHISSSNILNNSNNKIYNGEISKQ